MPARSKKELIPFAVGLLAIFLFFNSEITFLRPFEIGLVAVATALVGALYGWLFTQKAGGNAVALLGALFCSLLFVYGGALLLFAVMWAG